MHDCATRTNQCPCVPFNHTDSIEFLSIASVSHRTTFLTQSLLLYDWRPTPHATGMPVRTQDFSDNLSGTTAIVAFFENTSVWVANVGDSRAIVGKLSNGELKATSLSTDQTPYRMDERERIRAAGGEIMSVDQREGHVPMHDNWDIDLGVETDTDGDPPRVWVPGKEKPGCADPESTFASPALPIYLHAISSMMDAYSNRL
jgi:hypothetical protein